MRILAISDTEEAVLYEETKRVKIGKVDLIISCGDLSPEYLSYISTIYGAPLFFVRGNHDQKIGPNTEVGQNIHNHFVTYRGFKFFGLEGSPKYSFDGVQYTEREMRHLVYKSSLKEAAHNWWQEIFQPAVSLLDRSQLNKYFPRHSQDDLFLYILHHQLTKAKLQGRNVTLEEAVSAFQCIHPDQIESLIGKLFRGFVFNKKCARLCQECARNCPEGLICLEDGRMKIAEKCEGCGLCTTGCQNRNLVPYQFVAQNPHEIISEF